MNEPLETRSPSSFRDLAADALRYWEPRRVLYNVALFAVVGIHFATGLPRTLEYLSRDSLFTFYCWPCSRTSRIARRTPSTCSCSSRRRGRRGGSGAGCYCSSESRSRPCSRTSSRRG